MSVVLLYTGYSVPQPPLDGHQGLLTSYIPAIRGQQLGAPLVKKLLTSGRKLVWKKVLIFRMWLVLIAATSSHLDVSWNAFWPMGLEVICHHWKRCSSLFLHLCISPLHVKQNITLHPPPFTFKFSCVQHLSGPSPWMTWSTPRNYTSHMESE